MQYGNDHWCKGGSQKQHTPVEQPDSAQSMARCRMLLALGKVSLLAVWMRQDLPGRHAVGKCRRNDEL
jgi:hypothetical protein